MKRYPHCDVDALEEMLRSAPPSRKRGLVTESVFSMDGDLAPLDKIAALAKKYDCLFMVDEAHALGVLGENGKGGAEHFGIEGKIDIQMGTLSKAIGTMGAYVCGSKDMTSFLLNKARSFIYTTAMPPAVACAAREGLSLIENEPQRRRKLWENTDFFREGLKEAGFDTLNSRTPIIPLAIGDASRAFEFSQKLFKRGIFVPAIRPPTVPVNTARLRISLTAAHQRKHLEETLEQIKSIGGDLCLI